LTAIFRFPPLCDVPSPDLTGRLPTKPPRALPCFFTGDGVGVRDSPLEFRPSEGEELGSQPVFAGLPTSPSPSSPHHQDYSPGGEGTAAGRGSPKEGDSEPGMEQPNGRPSTRAHRHPPISSSFSYPSHPVSVGWEGKPGPHYKSLCPGSSFFYSAPAVSSSTSISEEEAERLTPHSRPEGRPLEAFSGRRANPIHLAGSFSWIQRGGGPQLPEETSLPQAPKPPFPLCPSTRPLPGVG